MYLALTNYVELPGTRLSSESQGGENILKNHK
jgi:hypothetical protein